MFHVISISWEKNFSPKNILIKCFYRIFLSNIIFIKYYSYKILFIGYEFLLCMIYYYIDATSVILCVFIGESVLRHQSHNTLFPTHSRLDYFGLATLWFSRCTTHRVRIIRQHSIFITFHSCNINQQPSIHVSSIEF